MIFFILGGVFFSCDTFSESKNNFCLPNGEGNIFWECEQDLCNTYLKLNKKKSVIISENSSSPSIDILNKNLVRIYFSCGSPCNYTIFYDGNNGVSKPFELAIALDVKRKIVLLAKKNHLVAYKIFENLKKPLFSIKRNWSPTATLFGDIIEAKFIDDGLYIKYLEGKNFNEKEEVIHSLVNDL